MSLGVRSAKAGRRGAVAMALPPRRLSHTHEDASQSRWVGQYLRAVWITDAAVVSAAVFAAQIIRFGNGDADGLVGGMGGLSVTATSVLLIGAWLSALRGFQTLDRRTVGAGSVEYSRVASACFAVFGGLAIIVLATQIHLSRGYFALALPLGTIGLLASRWGWRQWLIAERKQGRKLDCVLAVGDGLAVAHLVRRLRQTPEVGFDVIGACLPVAEASGTTELSIDDQTVKVYGDFSDVTRAVSSAGATTVAVMSAEALGHSAMQDLSWSLQGMDVEMMVAPGVTDVAGPRMLVRPVAGLPLLHIDKPRYEGATRFRKAAVDRVGAALVLFMCAPILILIALAIKLDSRGDVFYRATRVGLNNEPFSMWKFRTMVPDADAMRSQLLNLNEGAGALFKIKDDPRVTRVGKILRRYSIDELPQLFNVIGGSMSLVGPRPPLREEVDLYDGRIARRMLVKPGMTGLWQVSGRSDLSWEESVRLDLSYVENWSIMQDLVIMWRTVRAVMAKDGAY